jgi:hypothetical protein
MMGLAQQRKEDVGRCPENCTPITRNEIEDLCEGELPSKFYAIMNDIRTDRAAIEPGGDFLLAVAGMADLVRGSGEASATNL